MIIGAYVLIFFLSVYAGFRATGYDVLSGEKVLLEPGTREIQGGCTDLYPLETRDYYLDPEGVCAPCSDAYAGSVEKPWCTLERAFSQNEFIAMSGGDRLFLRGGIHRYDHFKVHPPKGDLSGTASRPTVIAGYPGERVSIYGSVRVPGWERFTLADGTVIWKVNWLAHLQATRPHAIKPANIIAPQSISHAQAYAHIPQAVFIDRMLPVTREPFILQHANESAVFPPHFGEVISGNVDLSKPSYKNYMTMPPGYAYYEKDERNAAEYGYIFIRPPEILSDKNPNDVPLEVPLNYFGPVGPREQNYLYLANFSFRFGNGFDAHGYDGTITVSGMHNRLENLDVSYHALRGLGGGCQYCTIRNSTISFNGNAGSIMVGNNITYEGNVFKNNSWRALKHEWSAGGMKLIPQHHNFTIKNNLFQDNGVGGLWLDYTGDGCGIAQFSGKGCLNQRDGKAITWDRYIGAWHVIEGNVFFNDPLNFETSPGSALHPNIVRNNVFIGSKNPFKTAVFLQSSPHTLVSNNLFVDVMQGVMAHAPVQSLSIEENRARHRVTDTSVVSNVFMNVSFPVIFGESSSMSGSPEYPLVFARNRADKNVYYGTRMPNEYFRFMKPHVSPDRVFSPLTATHPLSRRAYDVDKHAYETSGTMKAYNGKALHAALSAAEYARYQTRSLEELEQTLLWSTGMQVAGDYIEWAVHPLYTFSEWQATGQDRDSVVADPLLTFDATGTMMADLASPALSRGFKSFSISSVPLPSFDFLVRYPEEGKLYTSIVASLNVSWTGVPLRACWYSLNGGLSNVSFKCGQNVSGVVSSEGSSVWSVSALDAYLRTLERRVRFNVDTLPPVIGQLSVDPASPAVAGSSVEQVFSAEVRDAVRVVLVVDEARQYPASIEQGAYVVRLPSLPVGSFRYFWEAYDSAGNLARSAEAFYVVEPPAPEPVPVPGEIVVVAPRASLYNGSVRELRSVVGGDVVACWYSLTNGSVNQSMACGETVSGLSSGEGQFNWLVGALDTRGSVSTSRVSFTVDLTAPDVAFVFPTPSAGTKLSQTSFTVNVSSVSRDLASLSFSVREGAQEISAPRGPGPSIARTLVLAPGTYDLFATALDRAGNARHIGPHRVMLAALTPPAQPPQMPPPALETPQPEPEQPPVTGLMRANHSLVREDFDRRTSLGVHAGEQIFVMLSNHRSELELLRVERTHLVVAHAGKHQVLSLGRAYLLLLDDDPQRAVSIEVVSLQPEHALATVLFGLPEVPAAIRTVTQDSLPASEEAPGGGVLNAPAVIMSTGDGSAFAEDALPASAFGELESVANKSVPPGAGVEDIVSTNQAFVVIGVLAVLLLVGIVVLWYFSTHTLGRQY